MSDWDDDDWNAKQNSTASVAKHNKSVDDGWDDEPAPKRNDDRSFRKKENTQSNSCHMNADDGDQTTFTIKKSNVGMVIGRGGSKIKELEQRFQVKLDIGKYFKEILFIVYMVQFIVSIIFKTIISHEL